MRYRGKEDGKGSKEKGGWRERGRGEWWVKGDEGTETPNGMHLLHEWYFLQYVDVGQIIITMYNRKLEEEKDKVKKKTNTKTKWQQLFLYIW